MNDIDFLLLRLGLNRTYIGYKRLRLSLELVLENPDYLLGMCKHVYQEVGNQLGCPLDTVERSISTLIGVIWYSPGNRDRFLKAAAQIGMELNRKPVTSNFIEILYQCLKKHREKNTPAC